MNDLKGFLIKSADLIFNIKAKDAKVSDFGYVSFLDEETNQWEKFADYRVYLDNVRIESQSVDDEDHQEIYKQATKHYNDLLNGD